MFIAVPSEKNLRFYTVLPEFRNFWSNLDLLVLYGYEKKFCPKSRMKTKKISILNLFSVCRFSSQKHSDL